MTNSDKTEIPLSKHFFPALLPLVGNEKYQMIFDRYRELFTHHDLPGNPILHRHLIEGILPGLALYQILRESGETQESALASIDRTFVILYANDVAKMKKRGRLPFIYPFLRIYIKPAMRQYPRDGWDMEWIQNDAKAIRFNMNSCFYFDTLSRYGAPELTASFCRVDDLMYNDFSPDVLWQRTKTIARGDTLCDFCFARATRQQDR